MVIAALLCFGILLVAWILAPGGPVLERVTGLEVEVEVEEGEGKALPVAA